MAANDLGTFYGKAPVSASVIGLSRAGDKLSVWCWSASENLIELGTHDVAVAGNIAREALLAAPGAALFVQNAAIELQRRRTSI